MQTIITLLGAYIGPLTVSLGSLLAVFGYTGFIKRMTRKEERNKQLEKELQNVKDRQNMDAAYDSKSDADKQRMREPWYRD